MMGVRVADGDRYFCSMYAYVLGPRSVLHLAWRVIPLIELAPRSVCQVYGQPCRHPMSTAAVCQG